MSAPDPCELAGRARAICQEWRCGPLDSVIIFDASETDAPDADALALYADAQLFVLARLEVLTAMTRAARILADAR
jgi:hypothetical protein